jgi:hypothetical protein
MALIAFLVALPWVAAIVWTAFRLGWPALTSENGHEFPTQASRLRAFSGGR